MNRFLGGEGDVMIKYFSMAVILAILFSCGKTNHGDAEYPQKVEITVVNPLDMQRNDQPVGLKLSKIRKKDSAFNENNFIAVVQDSEIAYQLVDHNGDNVNDGVLVLLNMKPKEKIKLVLKYNKAGKSVHHYKKRTYAELSKKTGGVWDGKFYKTESKTFQQVDFERVPDVHSDHSRYYRYEGPGWESDKIGYRFYLDWRNAVDIFGKKTSDMVLSKVGLDGWESYHEMSDWGMDILKVGPSLGMGSFGAWRDNKVEMVSKVDSTTLKIAINGPLCSAIVTNYYGWQLGKEKTNLRSRLSIKAGSRLTRADLHTDPAIDNLCTGLVKSDKSSPVEAPAGNGIYTFGTGQYLEYYAAAYPYTAFGGLYVF
jgi:hypothetical protein